MRRIIGVIGVLLIAASLGYLFVGRAPYVIDEPGPTFNVLGNTGGKPVITIHDATTYPVSGDLDALTVQEIGQPGDEPTWFQVWQANMDASKAVVPINQAYPPGVKSSQVYAEDAAMMLASQQDAQAAAMNYLGIKYKSRVYVVSMMTDSAATGIIAPGDYIDSVNGLAVNDADLLRERVHAWDQKAPLKVGITHKGVSKVVEVTPKAVKGQFYIGVYVDYKYEFPFKIDVNLGDVGGPSAGTMFAVGMIDKLTPGQLLAKNHVAGTGTINPKGQVGPIGGIVQKMYAARNAGATVFLAPTDNCSETVGKVPSGLQVYRISTLKTAVDLLTALQNNSSLSGFATCSK
jgi:PDZ domain-containing protein